MIQILLIRLWNWIFNYLNLHGRRKGKLYFARFFEIISVFGVLLQYIMRYYSSFFFCYFIYNVHYILNKVRSKNQYPKTSKHILSFKCTLFNSLQSSVFFVCCRSRRSVDFVHRRIRRRQDREHEESDSIFGLCCRVETQVQRGKSTSISTFIVAVVVVIGVIGGSGDGGFRRAADPLCSMRALDELNHRSLYEPFNLPMLP